MATFHLVRHGQSSANAVGALAGRGPGVDLTDLGREEIAGLADLLPAGAPHRLLRSPLLRCRTTAEVLTRARGWEVPVEEEPALVEVDYGQWTGRRLEELRTVAAWADLVAAPEAFRFPSGESLAEVSARASALLERLVSRAEPDQTLVLVSHGDVIQLILAAALRLPLADYRRLQVRTGSLSTIVHTPEGTAVTLVGATGRASASSAPAGLGGA